MSIKVIADTKEELNAYLLMVAQGELNIEPMKEIFEDKNLPTHLNVAYIVKLEGDDDRTLSELFNVRETP